MISPHYVSPLEYDHSTSSYSDVRNRRPQLGKWRGGRWAVVGVVVAAVAAAAGR